MIQDSTYGIRYYHIAIHDEVRSRSDSLDLPHHYKLWDSQSQLSVCMVAILRIVLGNEYSFEVWGQIKDGHPSVKVQSYIFYQLFLNAGHNNLILIICFRNKS